MWVSGNRRNPQKIVDSGSAEEDQNKKRRFFASWTTQSMPSFSPSPVIALQVMIFHLCVCMLSNSRPCNLVRILSVFGGAVVTLRISSTLIAPGTSLLFLNTSRLAPISRWHLSVDLAKTRWPDELNLLQKQLHQLISAVIETSCVGGIDHPYQRVGLLKIVLPVSSQRLLASNIP